MRFGRIRRGALVASLSALAWVGASAADPKPGKGAEKERVSGAILKVEHVPSKNATTSKARPAGRRLTINTDAVWRDWARDQSQKKDAGSTAKDAAKGRDSVATVGEPADANSLVVVEVASETPVETRFRSPDDETSSGSKTQGEPKDAPKGKSVHFEFRDLRPGLFVEVDFRTEKDVNTARAVKVIRPIGGPDSGSAETTK